MAKKWIHTAELDEGVSILRKVIPESWLGWLAGIIDGEGTITISPRKRTDGTCQHEGWGVSVRVTNTDKGMIKKISGLLQSMVGSSGFTSERRPNRCKTCYYWMAGARHALIFLRLIEPYLVTKKEQARIAIEFQTRISTRQGYNVLKEHGGFKGSALTDDEYQTRERMYKEIKVLNMKGGDRYG